MKKMITTLATLVFTVNVFAVDGSILEKEKWGLAGDKAGVTAAQLQLINELRAECGPFETSAIDIIEASENHTSEVDEAGNISYNYGVKVKVYCM